MNMRDANTDYQTIIESIDPRTTPAQDAADLRAIADAVDEAQAADAKVGQLVYLARENGKSWGKIAIALGVSRQWAHAQYAINTNA